MRVRSGRLVTHSLLRHPLFVFELGQLGAGWWAVPGGCKLVSRWLARQLVTGPSEHAGRCLELCEKLTIVKHGPGLIDGDHLARLGVTLHAFAVSGSTVPSGAH